MTPLRNELEAMRADGLSEPIREEFAQARERTRAWDRAHPSSIDQAIAWIDQLRALFGDPPVRREPWVERIFLL